MFTRLPTTSARTYLGGQTRSPLEGEISIVAALAVGMRTWTSRAIRKGIEAPLRLTLETLFSISDKSPIPAMLYGPAAWSLWPSSVLLGTVVLSQRNVLLQPAGLVPSLFTMKGNSSKIGPLLVAVGVVS